jgi:hypothetical protein
MTSDLQEALNLIPPTSITSVLYLLRLYLQFVFPLLLMADVSDTTILEGTLIHLYVCLGLSLTSTTLQRT